jgi:hypothetical protein
VRPSRKRWLKRFAWLAATLLLCVLLIALFLLSRAQLASTPGGVHAGVLIPISERQSVAIPIYTGSGERVRIPGFLDGPVVRRSRDGRWEARWFCEDRDGRASGKGATFAIDCAGKRHVFALDAAPVPAPEQPMPADVVVLSDLEGNRAFLDAALVELGVMDAAGAWRYGAGHLVILGDSVDRGRDVFAVLWRLHDLSRQATQAGGAVHVLIGNHEQYVLRGNVSRMDVEHLHGLRRMGGPVAAFAPDTVIGGWLRRQPVAVKLGRTLFVHGGVSPEVAKAGLAVSDLNRAMADYWAEKRVDVARGRRYDAVLGMQGVAQYRGLVMAVEDAYAAPSTAEVERIAEHFGVDRIVVAHTQVPQVESRHGGRVIAVNVNSDTAKQQALSFRAGEPWIVDLRARRNLGEDAKPPRRLRDLDLTTQADRDIVAGAIEAMRALSDLPHPY